MSAQNNNSRKKNYNSKKKNNSAHKKGPNKNRRPKSLTPARILQKYDNLLDQHITARRKYYEQHGRASGKQLDKVQNNFNRTLNDLRKFEKGLKDWQLEVLQGKINRYPEDRQFSSTYELEPVGENVSFSGEFEDPHLLPKQQEADYSDDTEESSGSIDDYYTYKGIDPPIQDEAEISDKTKPKQ